MSDELLVRSHSGVRLFDHDGDPIDIAALTAMPTDFAGRQGFNTVFGEGVQAQRADSISCQFQYSNSARAVVPSVSGSGSTANADNMAAVHITGAVGSSTLTSKDAVRYRPGCECCAQFTSKYIGAQAGVQHMHGFLTTTNGATSVAIFLSAANQNAQLSMLWPTSIAPCSPKSKKPDRRMPVRPHLDGWSMYSTRKV